jgi:hypothetical protein
MAVLLPTLSHSNCLHSPEFSCASLHNAKTGRVLFQFRDLGYQQTEGDGIWFRGLDGINLLVDIPLLSSIELCLLNSFP